MYGNPLFRYWWTVAQTEATFFSALFKRLASASAGSGRGSIDRSDAGTKGMGWTNHIDSGGLLMHTVSFPPH